MDRERNELLDRLVAEEALVVDQPSPPTDAFVGRRVYVFTGLAGGDVRAEMASRFRDYGADIGHVPSVIHQGYAR